MRYTSFQGPQRKLTESWAHSWPRSQLSVRLSLTGPGQRGQHRKDETMSANAKITAQVACEAIANDPDPQSTYDSSTVLAVWAEARKQGVGQLYLDLMVKAMGW